MAVASLLSIVFCSTIAELMKRFDLFTKTGSMDGIPADLKSTKRDCRMVVVHD